MQNTRPIFLLLSAWALILPNAVVAGGQVTARPCPFSCRLAGIPKSHCKDWRNGNTCYVEDLSKPASSKPPPPARPEPARRGYITYNNCPYKCSLLGIPKQNCRDWRDGDYCYVEDLTRNPGGPQFVGQRPPAPVRTPPPQYQPPPIVPPHGSSECDNISGGYLARPRANVYKVKKIGNIFGDKYRVSGSVEGLCLVEAGYFERGRKQEDIRVAPVKSFRRFEFEVEARADREPEIRVYNVNGDRDIVSIEDEINGDSGRGYDDYDRDRRYR